MENKPLWRGEALWKGKMYVEGERGFVEGRSSVEALWEGEGL